MALPYGSQVGACHFVWVKERLLFVRQVWEGDTELFQGSWMNWPAFRETLLSSLDYGTAVGTLVSAEPRWEGHVLSGIPARYVPPPPPPLRGLGAVPRLILVLAWTFTLLALGGGALVLAAAIRFGEQRAAFVSAVTHELRTPLTTFRLYAEMLTHGMVPDPEEQKGFFRILLTEAERLDHLVRNVLSFARLESRRGARLEDLDAGLLVERLLPRLEQRATQAGRSLALDLPDAVALRSLRTDPALVEQILFNLVDNACKYGLPAQDLTLHLQVWEEAGRLRFRVGNHGPTIPEEIRKHLFRPFHKSAQAATGAPGVGLGLALCRGLARNLGGDLELDATWVGGTAFVLCLPVH